MLDYNKDGCMLAKLLFNTVLEWIVRKTERIGGLHPRGEQKYILAYTDDVDLMVEDTDLQRMLQSFVRTAKEVGLEVNVNKIKLL